MLNSKKLEMAYQRYEKNFVDGIKFEDITEEYEDNRSEIINTVELNAVEKDHLGGRKKNRYYLTSLWITLVKD